MGGNLNSELTPQQRPGRTPAATGLLAKVRLTLEMIKFEHSVFALPFALTGALLARRGLPTWRELFWIAVAMVGARSAAMTFNRLADLKLDALNPRTQARPLPAGQLSPRFAVGFIVVACGLLVLAAYELNPLAFKLSPVAILILLGYSFTKRFTLLSHLILGLCLGM
jgi:4-hydroxybenzoate polyprenyltransferase